MQYFSYTDKREVLQQKYSQPLILPSHHFRERIIYALTKMQLRYLYNVLHHFWSESIKRSDKTKRIAHLYAIEM